MVFIKSNIYKSPKSTIALNNRIASTASTLTSASNQHKIDPLSNQKRSNLQNTYRNKFVGLANKNAPIPPIQNHPGAADNVAAANGSTSTSTNTLVIYIVTGVCVVLVLSLIVAFAIYIWNRRSTVNNRLHEVEYKSPPPTSANEASGFRSSKQRNCWFKFGALSPDTVVSSKHDLESNNNHSASMRMVSSSFDDHGNTIPNTNGLLDVSLPHSTIKVEEVQPNVSPRQQSYYLGNVHTIAYSPQSPAIVVLATSSIGLPSIASSVATTTSASISASNRISTSYRAKNKGLLESRRGSRTSLTLSLSPSADSISSTRSPSPQLSRHITSTTDSQSDYSSTTIPPCPGLAIDHDKSLLATTKLPLTLDQLAERIAESTNRTPTNTICSGLQQFDEMFFQEFWSLPMNHPNRTELSITGMANKNRYKSILPNEKTRVILPQICDNPLSTYINANYIKGYYNVDKRFIATQGPMPHTIDDFWRMIWYTQSTAIVMLTKLTEKKKRKCEYYLPSDSGNNTVYGDIVVCVDTITENTGYTVRRLKLKHNDGVTWLYTKHYWFISWPDHGCPSPETTTHLLSLVATVEFSPAAVASTGPTVVHCSAGLGRTGCFLALCIGCHQLLQTGSVDILGIIARIRLDRGGLVNNHEQYEFLHRALLQYAIQILHLPITSSVSLPHYPSS